MSTPIPPEAEGDYRAAPQENPADRERAVRTLADALLAEITRVRDIIMPDYILLERSDDERDRRGVAPALAMMRAELDLAMRALAEHDATTCLKVYESLQGYTK